MALTADTITNAKNGDLEAVQAVTAATDRIIASLALEAANKGGKGHLHVATLKEELEAEGRLALWEAISRYDADHHSGAAVETFLFQRIRGAIHECLQRTVNPGADLDALRVFVQCLRTLKEPNLDQAAQLCTTLPEKGRRLSPDRAQAAKLAYQGAKSLDAPLPGSEDGSTTLGDTLAELVPYDVPEDLLEANDRHARQRHIRLTVFRAVFGSLSDFRQGVLRIRSEFGQGSDLEMPTDDIRRLARDRGLKGEGILPTATEVNDAWRKGIQQLRDSLPVDVLYPAN
ncbi:hypothetical protein [Streptomyces ardesiacus]|uniref:hypothetical protein n=1 Tax=Streptomyces ardesiacus TaxID=285564 RepID=UPI000D59E614|nr:hypothetical protein [Streptomyces ardesiacus]